jgi:hypothetical protein
MHAITDPGHAIARDCAIRLAFPPKASIAFAAPIFAVSIFYVDHEGRISRALEARP